MKRALALIDSKMAQAKNWLDNNWPGVKQIAVASNAEAARMAGDDASIAAIAGDIAAEICRYAESAAVDLIVIATHGRTGLSDALVGSVTSHVMRRASCPTMIVKPDSGASHA